MSPIRLLKNEKGLRGSWQKLWCSTMDCLKRQRCRKRCWNQSKEIDAVNGDDADEEVDGATERTEELEEVRAVESLWLYH